LRFALVLFLVLCFAAAYADTLDYAHQAVVVMSIESGPVNVQGTADLAKRAIEVLKTASYDRDWTVAAYLSSHPLAERKLERINLDSRRAGTKFLSDGAISEEYDYPLVGAVLSLILPPTGGGRLLGRTACPVCGQPWPEGKEPPPGVTLVPYEDGSVPEYSGILIDARGLGFRPALFPRAVVESGDVVIGPEFASAERLAQAGAFAYFRDRSEALTSERIGASPLVVRALRVSGNNQCDLVVSQYEAARIHGSKANLDLLLKCRVGLLVD